MRRMALATMASGLIALGIACGDDTQDDGLDRAVSPPMPVTNGDQGVFEGDQVILDGSNSYDLDGDLASHAWKQTSGPDVALSGTATATASFTAPSVQTMTILRFSLTVEDRSGLQSAVPVTITVMDRNPGPVVNAGPDQTANAGDTITFVPTASDPGGTVVSYLWEQVYGQTAQINNGAQLLATAMAPPVNQNSFLVFRLNATDNEGKTTHDDVLVHVLPVVAKLKFASPAQAAAVLRNAPWSDVTVELLNAADKRIIAGAAASLPVTLSLKVGTGNPAALKGELTVMAVAGLAVFDSLHYQETTSPAKLILEARVAGLTLEPVASPEIEITWTSLIPGGFAVGGDIDIAALGAINDGEKLDILAGGYFNGADVKFDLLGIGTGETSTGRDAFLARYDGATGALEWVRVMGGTGDARIRSLSVSGAGNIHVALEVTGIVLLPQDGTSLAVTAGTFADVAVAKLDSNGYAQWAAVVGTSAGTDLVASLALDGDSTLVAGSFHNTVDFDPGAGVANTTSAGSSDAFVLKLNAAGEYAWHKTWGDGLADSATGMARHFTSGTIYFSGNFGRDGYVMALNADGTNAWPAVARLVSGGTVSDEVQAVGVAVDGSGNVHVAGSLKGIADFNPSPTVELAHAAGTTSDLFWVILNSNSSFGAAHFWGGDDTVTMTQMRTCGSAVCLGGTFGGSVDLDPSDETFVVDQAQAQGPAFVLAMGTDGNFRWAGTLDGPMFVIPTAFQSISAAGMSAIYIAGATVGSGVLDIDPGKTRVEMIVPTAKNAVFILKTDPTGTVIQ